MSTWTSERRFLRGGLLAALLLLPGCEGGPAQLDGLIPARMAPKSIRVVERRVAIVGPAGYCVDKSGSRDGADGAFVLLGACSSISQNPRDERPRSLAVLTASVSRGGEAGGEGALGRLETFFRSQAGRSALSRSGDAATVEILDIRRSDRAVLIHLSDRAPGGLNGVAPDYWRGVFEVQGHVVSVTVNAFAGRPLGATAGRALLADFVASVAGANPDAGGSGGGRLSNFFNRLP